MNEQFHTEPIMNVQFISMPIYQGAQFRGSEHAPALLTPVLAGLFGRHVLLPGREVGFSNLPGTEGSIELVGEACRRLSVILEEALKMHAMPVVIGGDHSLAWASLGTMAKHFADLHCIYVDAHGDFNTPQGSPSGHVHGMHLSFLADMGPRPSIPGFDYAMLRPERLHLYGTRALDPCEKDLALKHRLDIHNAQSLTAMTPAQIFDMVRGEIAAMSTQHLYLSFDIDAVDPLLAPGTGVPEPNGLTVEQARAIVSATLQSGKTVGIDVVEYNPLLDSHDRKTLAAITRIFTP